MTATKGKLAGVKVGDELLIRDANERKSHRSKPPKEVVREP